MSGERSNGSGPAAPASSEPVSLTAAAWQAAQAGLSASSDAESARQLQYAQVVASLALERRLEDLTAALDDAEHARRFG